MGRAAERKRLIKEELDKQVVKKKESKNEELREREDYDKMLMEHVALLGEKEVEKTAAYKTKI